MIDWSAQAERFRRDLLEDTLPFWIRHGWDREQGGVLTSLGRDGRVLDTDKSIWFQGRCAWTLFSVCRELGELPGALEMGRSCLAFLAAHGAGEGRLRFLVTREGRPLRQRRYPYPEAFACLGAAAAAAYTGEGAEDAMAHFEAYRRLAFTPGLLPAKVDPQTRPVRGLGPLMIGIHLCQELRNCLQIDGLEGQIDAWIGEIEGYFYKPEHEVLMETVAQDGSILEHFEGRTLNPGHAIEAAWFILEEARHRGGDGRLRALGVNILDWMWARGWDEEYGGLFYFRDLHGGPVQEYWHDMKFWWPHNEAVLACLLAYQLTGEARFAERFETLADWCRAHFADPEHGEWFGYLHRDGSVSVDLKGNHWKGPYHLPRMQLLAARLCSGLAQS